MFTKQKRKVDKKLMQSYHAKSCLLCSRAATPAHIKSRGAGGPDELWNLMPLCGIHHTMQGQVGIRTFVLRHEVVKNYLWSLGWQIIDVPGGAKLYHPKL